jgi:hypothetical protein
MANARAPKGDYLMIALVITVIIMICLVKQSILVNFVHLIARTRAKRTLLWWVQLLLCD